MALTIKQLNGDASFLLTFEPIEPDLSDAAHSREPFRILLDPCLTVPACLQSPSCSYARTRRACVSPKDVPEPDLIIISNSRSDHCNEDTLRHFARGDAKTLILAEPTAAKVIRSWRCFEQGRVLKLQRWKDPRNTSRSTVIRMPIPRKVVGGDEGRVTVAFIAQKRERKGLHSAVGITYQPPSSTRSISTRPRSALITSLSTAAKGGDYAQLAILESPMLPRFPSLSPLIPPTTPVSRSIRTTRSMASLSPHAKDRCVSLIFSPRGISYYDIEAYATSNLLAEAALPLTVLLHSFDTVSKPWWLGRSLASGFEDGQEITAKLGARVWIRACDADKDLNDLARRFTRRKRHTQDEVREVVRGAFEKSEARPTAGSKRNKVERPTEVLALNIDEEVTVTSEGIWAADPPSQDKLMRSSIRHL